MNKYVVIGIIIVLIIAGGSIYRAKFLPEAAKPIVTGVERELSIVVFEDTWKFEPEFIEVDQGDRIIITVTNNDDYDHGFAIDAFGISQRMPANETILVDFVVTKAGDFPYYCSVSCGSGVVDGVNRGHFDQVGRLHVRSIIGETSGLAPIKTDEEFAKEARESSTIVTSNIKATELGYDVEQLNVSLDDGNILWGIYSSSVGELESLSDSGKDYQAVLYRSGNNKPVLWVFIDTLSGDVLATLEVE